MKQSKRFLEIALISIFGLILASCQKEIQLNENEMISGTEAVSGTKSQLINSGSVSGYLTNMIEAIETLESDGLFNEGNANSLIVKLKNAIKSIEKGNANAFKGQLNAFINEIWAFINKDSLTYVGPGITLIKKADNAIILADGSFVDARDGYEYPVVLIGDQLWMAENLRATIYTDGTEIPLVTIPADWQALTTGACCWFANNFEIFGSVYGAMYNWDAVQTGNLCPDGWHVPEGQEWSDLSVFLVSNGYGYGGSGEGIAKAMAATSMWANSPIAGTPGNEMGTNNSSGFNLLPGGQRGNNGFFYNPNIVGNWWSATAMIPNVASYGRNIVFNRPTFLNSAYHNKMGLYVRCIRN